MKRPELYHEKWHGFDIIGGLDPGGMLTLKYSCSVDQKGEQQFAFVGSLDRYTALSMTDGEEDLMEATIKELALKRVRAIIDLRTFEQGEIIERSLRVLPESDAEEISDLELRRKLLEVLYTIRREYPRSYDREQVDIDGLCWELGISTKLYDFTIDYLGEEELLKRPPTAQDRYSQIFITHKGIDAYQRGLLVGPVVEELVVETREFVDSKLQRLCPTAAQKLAQTYADVLEGDTELRLSQIAYACRQILEDFTDAICHPEFLGIEIELPPKSKTKNKIQAALRARIPKVGKTGRELIEALAAYVDDYFDRLNEYIQKCVHPGRRAQVEAESAKRCLIYTYLLIADVLSLLS